MSRLLLTVLLSGCAYVSTIPSAYSMLGLSKSQISKKFGGPQVRFDTDSSEVYLYQDYEYDRNKSQKIEFIGGKVIAVSFIETFDDFKNAENRWKYIIGKHKSSELTKDTIVVSKNASRYKIFKVQEFSIICKYTWYLKEKILEVSEIIRKN